MNFFLDKKFIIFLFVINKNYKILIFDFNIEIFTPHRTPLIEELIKSSANNLRINLSDYNFNDLKNFEKFIKNCLNEHSPDLILIDHWIVNQSIIDFKFHSSHCIFDKTLKDKSSIVFKTLLNYPNIIKIILPWFDPHKLKNNFYKILCDLLEREDFYLWALKHTTDFNSDLSDRDDIDISIKKNYTNFYKDLIRTYPNKIIPFIHSIKHNFYFKKSKLIDYDEYEFEFHVPGNTGLINTNYPIRKILLKEVNKKDLYHKNLNFLSKNLLNNYINAKDLDKKFKLLFALRYSYFDFIKKSRINYVDGGLMNYFVTKYLEVPFCGSVILSPNILSLETYGFKPMEHYILYENHLPDISKKYWNDEIQHIRNNAINLILSRHTHKVRVNQLYFLISSIFDVNSNHSFIFKSGILYNDTTSEYINDLT